MEILCETDRGLFRWFNDLDNIACECSQCVTAHPTNGTISRIDVTDVVIVER